MITLTPAAARQVHLVLEQSADEDLCLRVAARSACDGSVEYAIGLDEPREGDLSQDEKGVTVLVGPASRDLVGGTQIDFVEYEPGDFRFIFIPAQPVPGAAAARTAPGGGCSGCGGGCRSGA
jgi:iron-sulfur cluster assembly protein